MELPGAVVFDARHIFYGLAIRADTGSRAASIIRDWASQDGLQAALRQPGRALGRRVELLFGVAAAWHGRAGVELERNLSRRSSEEGPAPRVVAQELTGANADSKFRYDWISLRMVLWRFIAMCSKARALAPRAV